MSVFANEVGFSAAPGFASGGGNMGYGASPVGRGSAGSYQAPSRTPYQRPSGFKNSNGYNNRSSTGRGVTPQVKTQNTPSRGFNQQPSRSGSRGSGFRELLPKQQNRPKASGFGNTPQSRTPSRNIPIDTPARGAKRPYNPGRANRLPGIGGLPGNPFARSPKPFIPSDSGDIPLPVYPGRIPGGSIPPGPVSIPGDPIYGPAPFTGGQSAVVYDMFFEGWYTVGTDRWVELPALRVSGPVARFGISRQGTSSFAGYTHLYRIIVFNYQGQVIGDRSNFYGSLVNGEDRIRLARIVRVDGQPDTGGNPLGPQVGSTEPTRTPNSSRPKAPSPIPTPLIPNTPFLPPRVAPQRNLPTPKPIGTPLPSTSPLPDELKPPEKQPDRATKPSDKPSITPFKGSKGSLSPSGAGFGTGVDIGRALQRSLDSALNSDELKDIKRLLQNPTQTTNEGRNKIFPVNGFTSGGTGVDKSVGLINNPPFNKPQEDIDKCCQPSGSSGNSEVDLTEVTNLLKTNVSGDISLLECNAENPEVLLFNGQGIAGLSNQLDILADAMVKIWDKVKCPNDTELALPESWAIKTSRTVGQYVIIWRPVVSSGSRWSSTIPHPRHTDLNNAMAAFTDITYMRGDVMVNVQNSDNTQCIMNVESESEAQRLINWINDLTSLEYADSQLPKVTKGMKPRINKIQVRPSVVKYYSTGQTSMIPDWIFKLDDSGNPALP